MQGDSVWWPSFCPAIKVVVSACRCAALAGVIERSFPGLRDKSAVPQVILPLRARFAFNVTAWRPGSSWETKRSKGIAYVLFVVPSDAVNAYQQMDGQIFQ
eukprot:scaffold8156_cov18-Tisochrysis_lutea.AAC.1